METQTRKEREKRRKEEEIIQAAESIFCDKGFDDTSMEEIAAAAQFTRKTLYQYFSNKEDLYFAVALKGFKKLSNYLQNESQNEQTGFMKLYKASAGYYKFYKENPQTLRLFGFLGYVRKKTEYESERRKELLQYNSELFQSVAAVIAQGKSDGSICSELDSNMASFSLIFMMTGFFNQLSVTGATFMENFKLNEETFTSFSMDLLFKSIMSGEKGGIK